jgi:hypothetical protein
MEALRADTPTLVALGLMAAGTLGLTYAVVSRRKDAGLEPPADRQTPFQAAVTWWIAVGALSFVMKESSKAVEDLSIADSWRWP